MRQAGDDAVKLAYEFTVAKNYLFVFGKRVIMPCENLLRTLLGSPKLNAVSGKLGLLLDYELNCPVDFFVCHFVRNPLCRGVYSIRPKGGNGSLFRPAVDCS